LTLHDLVAEAVGMGILDARYPLDLTEEESAAGFEVCEAESGVRAIVRELDNGLRVVKRRNPTGQIEYAVCDAACHPLYPAAQSLAEVEARFGRAPARIKESVSREDPDIVLLLDNLELISEAVAPLPPSAEAGGLIERVAVCKALVKSWWQLAPRADQRAAVKHEVYALREELSALQAKSKQSVRLAALRPVLYQSTVLALNAANGPVAEDHLRADISTRVPVDAQTWRAFVTSEPTLALLSDGRVALLPRDVPGGEKAMNSAQYEVVRLVRIARRTLTVRELIVLLRYQNHLCAEWDQALVRSVLALEARLQISGDTVALATIG
jgi:hypothetical protein